MIIPNGTLQFKHKTTVAIDPQTGYPQPASHIAWSNPIPCQIIPTSGNLQATLHQERYTKRSYTLLIDHQTLPQSEQIKLTDEQGNTIGEFSLIAPPEEMTAVDQIKLTI